MQYEPKTIIAIDYFNYSRAWEVSKEYYKKKQKIEFLQSDIINLKTLKDNSIDIIGSDAVFEHINEFRKAVEELKKGFKEKWYFVC